MHIWVGALLLVAGCGRSGVLEGAGEGAAPSVPLPQGAPAPEDPGTSPTDLGRGLDGPIVFNSSVTEIDDCVGIVSAAGAEVELMADAVAIVAGRRILVMQMNDAIGASGPTQPVNPGRAGQWEIAEVKSAADSEVTLVAPLANAGYETDLLRGFRAQACLVREYTNVTVAAGARVEPREWDGTRGGVLAWQVSGTLDVQSGARLSADGSGFRGGICGMPANASNVTSYDVQIGSGGGKGEGLDSRWYLLFGRGAVANAGGGGNGLNAGGGGGGGAGAGGGGGRQRNGTGVIVLGEDPTRGLAGGALVDSRRLVFGGGGGAGHLDGAELSRCGGAGGGVLYLRAGVLAGTGRISADGETGAEAEYDGAGGGGAGGTVEILALDAAGFGGDITADGGNGGDVKNTSLTNQYGPGGGGGGGSVRATGITGSLGADGGRSGMNLSSGNPWTAELGNDGLVLVQ